MNLPRYNSRQLAWPTDWAALFGAERPLILEIGFGYGQFLRHLAHTYPDHHVIGLEISNRCLMKVEAMVEREGLANVRLIHSTAETALAHLFTPGSLSAVYINFPDPWFKTRHGHRRLMQRDTLDALVNRLAAGGGLYLATDIIEYAEMSAELLAATPGLDNLIDAPWADHLPGRVLTKYEQKARREGRDCYYFAYWRSDQPAPAILEGRELTMPHVVFETTRTLGQVQAAFEPVEHEQDGTYIHLMHAYLGAHSLLVEVFVKEPTIEQRVALMVLQRLDQPQEYTLQLSTLGYPRTTPGIHQAVALVVDWLRRAAPDIYILKHTVQSELGKFG